MPDSSGPRSRLEIFRDGMVVGDRIIELLSRGPKTIPELAEELGFPDYEVTAWVMELRRYGPVTELPKSRADDYYTYTIETGDGE